MRVMVFVDGENIVFRYQAMIKKGKTIKEQKYREDKVDYKADIYLWTPSIYIPCGCDLVRVYYYTSASGDVNKISLIAEEIKKIEPIFDVTLHTGSADNLYPIVFKKTRRDIKSKGVDIKMAVDILSNVHQNNVDLVYLISGDGDYKPVVEEVIRQGKRVWIAAFSDGLNPALKLSADRFIDLDNNFFERSD